MCGERTQPRENLPTGIPYPGFWYPKKILKRLSGPDLRNLSRQTPSGHLPEQPCAISSPKDPQGVTIEYFNHGQIPSPHTHKKSIIVPTDQF